MKKISLLKVNLPPKNILLKALEHQFYEDGYIAEGNKVIEFENKFGNYINNQNIISVNSGTSALHLALILAGVKPGDEVISTPATSIATNQAILISGAKIVWADVDPFTGNLYAESIEKKVNKKTKAIVVVHYGGIPAHLNPIIDIGRKYSIPIIEDAAHALGALYENKKIGCHSDYIIFSFQAVKTMTTVDGGALVCKRVEDVKSGKIIRWFGIDKNFNKMDPKSGLDIAVVGYKYHMNNITAVIGLTQMERIEDTLKRYRENAEYYNSRLGDVPGITLCLPFYNCNPSYWLYTLRVEKRDEFIEYLNSKGIEASIVHPRNDTYSIFKEFKSYLPGVDEFYNSMVHIPVGWWLEKEDLEYIFETIRRGW